MSKLVFEIYFNQIICHAPMPMQAKVTPNPSKKPAYTCPGVCRLRIKREVPTKPDKMKRIIIRKEELVCSTK